ncbi:hypothetical protein GYMLUDRAFT_247673 [Collybiopsis luxurians FD-317 M1]|uniref:RRM domain-containing protein n=1 Tax=Collybiopsis luxurians FD-317 M1 TaxID=944289 RepID=A0A0D0BNR2_9AGAR|nr:hypothetical protein GYMLUDRAFT_247673 [Collybiopsis luxurians FD-317 M1]
MSANSGKWGNAVAHGDTQATQKSSVQILDRAVQYTSFLPSFPPETQAVVQLLLEKRGSSENVQNSPAPASTSSSQTPAKAPDTSSRTPHPSYAAAQGVTTAQCFIKRVNESITTQALTEALSRFGSLKRVDIVRSKACAFVEFSTVDAARSAIVSSLPSGVGDKGGGVEVDVRGSETFKVFVETRRKRGDRPTSRGRGGGPPLAGGGRGSGFV